MLLEIRRVQVNSMTKNFRNIHLWDPSMLGVYSAVNVICPAVGTVIFTPELFHVQMAKASTGST